MRRCTQLANVNGLKDLKALQRLDLSGCKQLANVNGLKDLEGLQTLDLSGCQQLDNVEGLKDLKTLQTLQLTRCPKLSREAVDQLRTTLLQTEITADEVSRVRGRPATGARRKNMTSADRHRTS